MARAARMAERMRRTVIVGLSALAGGLLAACGAPGPSAPGPSPEPAPAGFLHVLQDGQVVTYAIDAATGRLRQGGTLAVGDAHTLAGDPQGRYVYAAFGTRTPRSPSNEPKVRIV